MNRNSAHHSENNSRTKGMTAGAAPRLIPRRNRFCFKTPGGVLLLAILCLLHFWGFLSQASAQDAYEAFPYDDSASATTQNFLEPYTAQDHTIHSDSDIDWGIVYQISPSLMEYTLVFTDRVLPSGTALRVKLYEDGPDHPATWTEDIGPGAGEYPLSWLGTR